MEPTIYALSSARGPGGIAVFRISGPRAGAAVRMITRGEAPPARVACLRSFRFPRSGEVIDRGLVLWFPGPRSATGFDVAEFHTHGGTAVAAAMLDALEQVPGLTLAPPGGFLRQSFASGRIDLTQAEGVADLIAAETETQRRQALRQSDGVFGASVRGWQDRLLQALAITEAALDFPDEDDVPGHLSPDLRSAVAAVAHAIAAELGRGRAGERLRDGVRVAIVGPPNAGKSSLLNALARRDAAIVSAIPGTTRDVIEVHLDLGGVPVALSDTAGLRDTADPIEQEGVRRASGRAAEADLRLWVFEAGAPRFGLETGIQSGDLVIANKADLGSGLTPLPEGWFAVSVRFGTGMAALTDALTERVATLTGAGTPALVTRARHRMALADTLEALKRWEVAASADLAAEDLRLALRGLGRIVGSVDVEDILDVIFRSFCIGK